MSYKGYDRYSIGYGRKTSGQSYTYDYEDDYYGGGYSGYGYKKEKKNTRTYWSWDFDFESSTVENNDHLFVKEPVNYITPTTKEVELKSGAWRKDVTDQIKELARVCYFKMIGDKEYVSDKWSDVDKLSEEDQAIYSQKREFYDTIYDQYIPGFTPLEQAVNIYLKMSKGGNKDVESMINGKEDNVEALYFDRELYTDPDINEQLEMNDWNKHRKLSILNKMSIIGDLGTEFQVEKEISEKIVTNSDITSKKLMRDYSQIHQVDLYQKLMPDFNIKLLTKDLVVNVPVTRKEQKQKIIILVDYSGSMCDTTKQDWINALLMDRFKYVLKGEAEVFFSFFVHSVDTLHFHHIHDKESVVKFWRTFSNSPNGGTTAVGTMVKYVASEIRTYKKLHNLEVDLSEEEPEILVINDGEDLIDTSKFPYKVNAVTLMQDNNQLSKLCVDTKGKYVNISYDEKIVATSESGTEIINQ